jgi:ATP-binding cassette subfamily B protein
LLDELPQAMRQDFADPILQCLKTDINSSGEFSEQWVILTAHSIIVKDSQGQQVRAVPLSVVMSAKTQMYVGGGRLSVETTDGTVALAHYSPGLAPKVSVLVGAINALAKGEELPAISERDLPKHCPKCGRPLDPGTSVCPLCIDKRQVMSRLIGYVKPYRGLLLWTIVLLVLATVVSLVPPYLTKLIVDKVLTPHRFGSDLLLFVISLLVANVLQMLLQAARGYLGVWLGSRMMGDIRRDVYNALMRLSLSYFDKRQTSQFIGRVNNDAESMQQFLTDGVIMLTSQATSLIAIIVLMLRLNWFLAVLAFVTTPLILVASVSLWPIVRHRWYRQWRARVRLNVLVGDSLNGIRVVKAFGQESLEKERYEAVNHSLVGLTTQMDGMWQTVFPLFNFISGFGLVLVWYFGGREVLHNTITLGTLMAFISYLNMFFGPLQWFSQLMNWVTNALASAERVFEIIDTVPEVREATDAKPMPIIEGRVQIESLTFGYERHHPVLENIDLDVAPGEMIGLVGHSGAGKSTFINLLCRFYDPDRGHILLDGTDLRHIQQEDLHRQIGVVLQETFLFDGTVMENIAYAKPDATPYEVIRAAKIANAHGFILRMADGYDTRVGERGHRLSGGEKQRIAIARAVLHDPQILILDEATASLDTETERQIQEAIGRLVKGRTTFAIAHRLSTLRNANRLVVFDRGKIVEAGTHEELLASEGIYHKLVQAQMEMSQIRGIEG